mmetsp:Transcript_33377/g.83214  ORF Transcript_33377/g.83214 Transcript_33377/m.83214 type:complete len:234 (-) Transcript_33377:1050-1751(-)
MFSAGIVAHCPSSKCDFVLLPVPGELLCGQRVGDSPLHDTLHVHGHLPLHPDFGNCDGWFRFRLRGSCPSEPRGAKRRTFPLHAARVELVRHGRHRRGSGWEFADDLHADAIARCVGELYVHRTNPTRQFVDRDDERLLHRGQGAHQRTMGGVARSNHRRAQVNVPDPAPLFRPLPPGGPLRSPPPRNAQVLLRNGRLPRHPARTWQSAGRGESVGEWAWFWRGGWWVGVARV